MHSAWDLAPASTVGRGAGETAGVQLGYNWQVTPNVLLGIEGGFSGAALKFSSEAHPLLDTGGGVIANSNFTATELVRSLASVRGRFGFVSGDWLFFGTAGWAWADTTMGGDVTCPTLVLAVRLSMLRSTGRSPGAARPTAAASTITCRGVSGSSGLNMCATISAARPEMASPPSFSPERQTPSAPVLPVPPASTTAQTL